MAGRSGAVGGGNLSPNTTMKCKEKLSNVLDNQKARKMFLDFLKEKKFDMERILLDFWEKCDKFLRRFQNSEHHSQEKGPEGEERSTELKKEAQSIIDFADYEKINFDAGKIQALRTAVERGDKQKIMTAISQAKQEAAEMLEENGYKQFCTYLPKGQGVIGDKF